MERGTQGTALLLVCREGALGTPVPATEAHAASAGVHAGGGWGRLRPAQVGASPRRRRGGAGRRTVADPGRASRARTSEGPTPAASGPASGVAATPAPSAGEGPTQHGACHTWPQAVNVWRVTCEGGAWASREHRSGGPGRAEQRSGTSVYLLECASACGPEIHGSPMPVGGVENGFAARPSARFSPTSIGICRVVVLPDAVVGLDAGRGSSTSAPRSRNTSSAPKSAGGLMLVRPIISRDGGGSTPARRCNRPRYRY